MNLSFTGYRTGVTASVKNTLAGLGLVLFIASATLEAAANKVCISELMYRPASENTAEEFIELHNPGGEPVDLTGWRFTTGVRFTFPQVQIPPGGYLVVAADIAAFRSVHPDVTNVVGGWEGILSNSGQLIELVDAVGDRVDTVRYADAGDWSMRVLRGPDHGHRGLDWHSAAEGGGASLELRNPALPNDYGQNWGPSTATNGTPGRANSIASSNIPPMILDPRQFPLIPRSTDPVTLSVRIIDELKTGIDVRVRYRVDGNDQFLEMPMFDDGAHDDGVADDGVFAATIPPYPSGTIIEFYFQAADALGNSRTYPTPVLVDGAFEQRANLLYQVDDSAPATDLPEYRLILRQVDADELRQINRNSPEAPFPTSDQTRSHAEFNGTFISIDGSGVTIRYLVDIRNRGNGSRSKRPQSFRVNFRSDDLWKSVAAINLNSQYPPAQLFGSVLYRRAGLPTQSSRPARVCLNGVSLATSGAPSYGFYAANEVLNSEFAAHVFPNDSSGNLYRGIRLSGKGADLHYEGEDPGPYRLNYFKQTNTSEDDWRDLIELTRVLDNEPDDTYADAVRRLVDVDEWMLYFALETLVDNHETNLANGNNGTGEGDDYFLYSGKVDSRFKVLPYDLDTILDVGDTRGNVTDSLFRMNANPQIARFMKHPDFAPIYYRTLQTLADTVFRSETFDALVDQTLATLAPESVITTIKSFAAARRDYVLSRIPRSISVTNLPPVTNGYPWTSSLSIDLAGLAPAAKTRSVTVNGQQATWTAWSASWAITGIPLRPGLNRILVQAFDSNAEEIARRWAEVWCEHRTPTQLAGTISTSTTLSAGESPYVVSGRLVVGSGVNLVIEPGATICFQSGAELVIADGGRLVAEGTEFAPICFSSLPGSGRWNGLTVNGSVGSPETRLSHAHFEGYGSTAIHSAGGTVFLDHVTFGTTDRQYLSLDSSSFVVQNCEFPTATAAFELVHGTGGIKAGGRGLFRRNYFGATTGYNDVVDFTGGNRPGGPIVEFMNNVFVGASDDHLDFDGTDAWIEGNIFLHAHKNGSPDTASGVSGGSDGGRTSEITILRNIFFDCDQAAMAKQGNFYVLLNNTIVHQSHAGGLDTDGAVICLADEGTAEGAGMFLHGNILYDIEKLVRNHTAAVVTLNTNLLPVEWNGAGSGNIVANPMFVHVPRVDETLFESWADAQVMWDWLSLRTGSPAHNVIDGKRDLGAVVPPGVFITGEPADRTRETGATLVMKPNIVSFGIPLTGWPHGAGYTHYKWRLDDGLWSELIPLAEPLALANLAPGAHIVETIGLRDSGHYQNDPEYGEDATTTLSHEWIVDPGYTPPPQPGLRFNEVLASNTTIVLENDTPDLVELYNDSDAELDIGGVGITTDKSRPYAFVFPPDTLVPPRGYIVLAGGQQGTGSLPRLGFALKQTGDTLYLFGSQENGGRLLDTVSWGLQIPNLSIGRTADGTWRLTQPTFGQPNRPQPIADPASLRINEWLAASGVVFRDDFIELFNTAPLPVELSGLHVSDHPVCPVIGYQAPPGASFPPLSYIAAQGFAKLFADESPERGGDHLSFKLNAEDGAISLVELDDKGFVTRIIDCVMYGPQTPDTSQGRSPDGAVAFARFDNPTPGSANPSSSPAGEVVTLTFPLISLTNVWKYWQNGDAGTEWRTESFDDHAWPSGEAPFGHDSDPTALPLRTQLAIGKMTYYFRTHFSCPTNAPGIRLQLQTYIDDGAALWLNGSLLHLVNISNNNPVYSTRADSTVDDAALSGPYDIAPGLLREGTNTLAVEVHQSSSSSGDIIFSIRLDAILRITNTIEQSLPVRLNEILASNASFTNVAGQTPDYVELVNIAPRDVDLSGWSLTDDAGNPRRYVFPAGSVIPASGFLVIECEGSSPASPTNIGFDLPASGGTLMLFGPADTTTPVDSVRFGLQVTDLSIGRTGHGTGNWALTMPTLGTDNEPLLTGNPFLLRINEWMAAPAKGEDWFELYNPGQQPVNISGLFLTDDLTDRARHKISPLSFIGTGSHAYVKFVADGNAGSGANHVSFKLAANGEQIGLFTESGALIDAVMFGPQTDGVSEGRFPDGSNNVVRFVENPTPGAPNQSQPESDSDGDGMPDSWEIANRLDPHNPGDAAIDSDGDGLTNLAEYRAGTSPHDPQSVLAFTEIKVADDLLRLRFYGIAGHAYLVEVANAIGTGTWEQFTEVPLLAQDALVEVTDSLRHTSGLRLYRVVLLPK